MNPASSIPPGGGQDWQVTFELWRSPLAPKSPTVRFLAPSSSPLIAWCPKPRPGDVNRVSGTSGWREGVTAPPLTCLVPVPGCLLRSEPAYCSRTPPAGRKFTPAPTSETGPSETGRKSSAGPETPPLVLLLPVGPCTLPVSDHGLEHASCRIEVCTCATTADTAGSEEPRQTRADAVAAERATRRAHADDNDPRLDEFKDGTSDSDNREDPMIPSLSPAVSRAVRAPPESRRTPIQAPSERPPYHHQDHACWAPKRPSYRHEALTLARFLEASDSIPSSKPMVPVLEPAAAPSDRREFSPKKETVTRSGRHRAGSVSEPASDP